MEQKLNPLLRLSPNPTLGVRDGCILLANPAADTFFDGSPVGRQISEYLPAHILQESAEEFVTSVVLQDRPVTLTVSRTDDIIYFILHPQQIVSEEGLIPPAILHNLRSSLFNIKLSVELTLRQLCPEGVEPSPKAASHAAIFHHNYYNLLRTITSMDTVNALLDGSLTPAPVMTDLNHLCDDLLASVRPLIAELGITLEFRPCGNEDVVAAVDRGLIEQMLLNLLSNSLLHTPARGSIHVAVSHVNKHFVFSITDTGSGISTEALTNLFSRFESAPSLSDMAGGIGFGLFIAKGIAELHGGTLIVESREGQGTSIRATVEDSITPNIHINDIAFERFSNHGMENILIQLASALPNSCYVPKILDS
ncbi:MAG: sensor histidine kinase [Oscillospiraceae bacterium]|jgi:signal transduction histidine kinase